MRRHAYPVTPPLRKVHGSGSGDVAVAMLRDAGANIADRLEVGTVSETTGR